MATKIIETCDFCGQCHTFDTDNRDDPFLSTRFVVLVQSSLVVRPQSKYVCEMLKPVWDKEWCSKCEEGFYKKVNEKIDNLIQSVINELQANGQFTKDLEELLK
jgi:hypothetical protein